jgi:hypothetical protein
MDIPTESGRVIPSLRLTKRTIINRTFALYGPSNSGKTVITKHLLDQLRGEVDQIIVVSPTEPVNQSYANYVPQPLIHYGFSAPDPKNPRKRLTGSKGAEAFLQQIWDRQEMLGGIYARANKPDILRSLFDRVSPELQSEARPALDKIQQVRRKGEALLKKKYNARPGEFKTKLKELCDSLVKKTGVVYKHFIRADFARLWARRQKLPEAEQWALNYLELNPGMVLILDDCAADIKPLFKKPEMRRYFYQNRHFNLTVIMCFQDDTDLDTNLRKNAFVSIFCSDVVCRSFFTRTSNMFNKETKKEVEEMIPLVYADSGEHEFRKIAYRRDDPTGRNYYHFTSPPCEERMFCSPAVLELCRELKSSESRLNEANPFFRNFQPY